MVRIATDAVAQARQTGRDVVILDTAGRLQVDDALMAEIRDLGEAVQPTETLLVVDAMVGQEAVAVAEAFHAAAPVTGLVLTKIDGDARGGAALSISAVSGLAVKFLGTGEKTDALEVFHPDRLAGRILGMGDVVSLVERAQETYDAKEAEKLAEKLKRNSFTLDDFLEQMQQVKKMGPLGSLMEMIPGLGGAAKQAQAAIDRGELAHVEAIIRSMTPEERRDPSVLNASRRRRIARGSGTSLPEVNRLVKQFGEMQRMMKLMRGRGGRRCPDCPWDDRNGPVLDRDERMTGVEIIRCPIHDPLEVSMSTPAQAATGRRGRWRWSVALVATAAMVVSGSGLVAFAQSGSGVSDGPRFVPADAPLYVEARLDLPDGQGESLASFLSAFPGFADEGSFETKIDEAVDSLLADATDGGIDDGGHPRLRDRRDRPDHHVPVP